MINSQKFSKRLHKIIESHSLSASAFADKIGVQRSSISHILSGRNKPSLDFVMKVVNEFPDVELYWLLNGKGKFPTSSKTLTKTAESSKSAEVSDLLNVPRNEIAVLLFFLRMVRLKNTQINFFQ